MPIFQLRTINQTKPYLKKIVLSRTTNSINVLCIVKLKDEPLASLDLRKMIIHGMRRNFYSVWHVWQQFVAGSRRNEAGLGPTGTDCRINI
jgi:hypothetical protein